MEVASCLRVAAEGCAGLQHPSLRPPRCDSIEFTLIRTKSFTGGPLRIGCAEDDGAESRAEAGKNPRPGTKHGYADHTKNEADATAKQHPPILSRRDLAPLFSGQRRVGVGSEKRWASRRLHSARFAASESFD